MTDTVIRDRYRNLLNRLAGLKSALIGFSGGVDSTFLVHAAREAMGDGALAVTLSLPYVPERETAEARDLAARLDIRHQILTLSFPESIRMNPPDRCYTCKRTIFGHLVELAAEKGIDHVLDGTNTDDLQDHRPGLKALEELGILSPLKSAGLSKADVRELSRQMNLPTWNKPAYACLMTRLPVGVRAEDHLLKRIDDAERFLADMGFPVVRVRHHGDVARIEVPADRIADLIAADRIHGISRRLKQSGYAHVSVDLAGYRMGSLNAPALSS